MTPDRRHSRAKKNTVETPVSANAHQTQFPATPLRRTISVTRLGVSALNVVATIDRPASHQGTARPEAKNSEVLRPARRPKNKAGPKQISSEAATMSQSRRVRRIRGRRSVSEVGSDREARTADRHIGDGLAVHCYHGGMALDERAFFTEKPETRPG